MFSESISEAGGTVQEVGLVESREEDWRLKLDQRQTESLLDLEEIIRQLGGGVHTHLGERGGRRN